MTMTQDIRDVFVYRNPFLITGIFLISYIGPYVPALVFDFRPGLKDVYHYNSLLVSVNTLQSAANPLVYLYSSSVYRAALKDVIPESVWILWRRVHHGNRIDEMQSTMVQASSVDTTNTTVQSVSTFIQVQPRRD